MNLNNPENLNNVNSLDMNKYSYITLKTGGILTEHHFPPVIDIKLFLGWID